MDAVFAWVATYGYGALFLLLMLGIVGLPIPDETLLVFSGYLISQGKLNFAGTLAAAIAGSWCGISLSYWIGRTLGLGVAHKFGKYVHLNDTTLARVHAWFDRRGHWALFGGYYVAGLRHITAIVAGASGVGFSSLVLFAWSGGLIWASGFLTLGYYIGSDWKRIATLVNSYLLVISCVIIGLAILYGGFRWFSRRPRAS